jgi:hypothetical protein
VIAALRDPYRQSLAVLAAIVLAGVAMIYGGAIQMVEAATDAEKVAFATSGLLGGAALAVFAAGLLVIQRRRHANAVERAELEARIEAALDRIEAEQTPSSARNGASLEPSGAPHRRRPAASPSASNTAGTDAAHDRTKVGRR